MAMRARLRDLIVRDALRHGEFVLASGATSSYYLDNRLVTLSAEGAYLVGALMLEAIRPFAVGAVGGPTLGADPIATAVAVASFLDGAPLPAFIVRKEPKGHGIGRQVDGPLPAGVPVAIVEDTVTSGGSVLKAVRVVEAGGNPVVAVLALVDRLEGGRELLEDAGYRFISLYTVRDLGVVA